MKGKPLSAVAHFLGSKEKIEGTFQGASFDSRQVKKGDLFFALTGKQIDGHQFLQEVASRGAQAAVVSKNYKGESYGLPLIRVDDVVTALQDLARESFAQKTKKVIAVTGSVGKTTTKEFLATILEAKYRVGKTPGNSNSQVGLPLYLLNAEGKEDLVVVEMGMTAAKEIAKLVTIAPPDVALITRIGLAHVEYFPDGLDGVAAAKAEIFSHPKTTLGIVNAQSARFQSVLSSGESKKILFGSGSSASDYLLCRIGTQYTIDERGKYSPFFTLPFEASHLKENFLAAAAAARQLGLSWEEIFSQTPKLKPFEKRFEQFEREGVHYINDCYNANPESMRAALANLPQAKRGGKRIAVFGRMVELGSISEKCHREIGELALPLIDHVLCFGKECEHIVDVFSKANKPAEFFADFEALKKRLFEIAQPKDLVLVKGSNSNRLWRLFE